MVWLVSGLKQPVLPIHIRHVGIPALRATLTEGTLCGNLPSTEDGQVETLNGNEERCGIGCEDFSPLLAVEKSQKNVRGGKPLSRTKMKLLKRMELEAEKKASVIESFFSYHKEQYRERWQSLLPSLQRPMQASCMMNCFAEKQLPEQMFASMSNVVILPFLSIPVFAASERFPQPCRDCRGVCSYYLLDAASVLATQALQLTAGDKVLDLCAAPGAEYAFRQVVRDYIPEEHRESVRVSSKDGTKWFGEDVYDKVLVDVPCSSERHLIHDESELRKWTPRRSATLAKKQYELLLAALRTVRVGGIVVYSTCSISSLENDGVIAKALSKSKVKFEVVQQVWAIGEKTEHGWIVLPDVAQGWGPLYFCSLRRLPSTDCRSQIAYG